MQFKKIVRYVKIVAILSLLWSVALEQDKPDTVSNIQGIEIETSVDKAEVYIGDLVNYTVTVIYDSIVELLPPPLGANLGSFDVKDYETDIVTKLPDGRLKSQSHFVLSTFTTGEYIIPPVPMAFQFPDGNRKILLSESVPITVNSLLLNDSDSADIRPLKAQFEFERSYTKIYILGAVILLIIVALAYYFWSKSRRRREVEQLDLRPAWEIAFEKLAKLEQKKYADEGQFKEYYLELTEILRSYFGRMFAANVSDMTTDEFFDKYESIGMPDDLRENLREFFNHADLVKFARFNPESERCQSDFTYTHDIIERLRKDFQLKAEMEARIQGQTTYAASSRITKGGGA